MTVVKLIFIWSMLLHGFEAHLSCTSPTPESLHKALKSELFHTKEIRPANFSNPINVYTDITVVGIIGLDEKTQTLTIVIWQVLQWSIEGLSWDQDTCGTGRFSVVRSNLWTPDIQISELMEEDKFPQITYVYLYNTGLVYDDKPVRVVSSCRLIIYTFPFDIQTCSLTFDLYLYDDTDVKLFPQSTSEDILKESSEALLTSGEWELVGVAVNNFTLELTEGNYSEVRYKLTLRRRPLQYVVNLLVPSCFLTTMDLFSFLLPPQSVDRSTFKMTLILGYTVFLLIMNDLLPANGETTPLINIFFSISLALMVASLLETLFVTNIHFSSSQYGAVPRWLSVLVLRYLAVVPPNHSLPQSSHWSIRSSAGETQVASTGAPAETPTDPCLEELRRLRRDVVAIRRQVDKQCEEGRVSHEWQMIGSVIDRLLFAVYIVFITASFIAIAATWTWNNSYEARELLQ